MNRSYQIFETFVDCGYPYELVVYDGKGDIKSYKYTNNIIKILEIDNVIELLNRHIKVYDEQSEKFSLHKLSLSKEKYIRDYLQNVCLELGMEAFDLLQSSKIKNELDDIQFDVIYNFDSGIKKVKEILEIAKNNSKEYSKTKRLVK